MRSTPLLHLALLVTSLALGCTSPSGDPNAETAPAGLAGAPAGGPPTLTIASYNVLYLLAEKHPELPPERWAEADTLKQVRDLKVDVLLLQETNDAWEAAIRSAVSDRLPHCGFHLPRKFLPEGLGICSRFPLEGDSLLPSAVGWFPAQRAVVRAPFGAVQLLNVHLRPAVAGPGNWMEVHLATRPDRKKEVEAYLAALPAGVPTLVVGDFNELLEGDLFGPLTAAGFDSAFAVSKEKSTTWRWAGTTPLLEAQIDHIAYSRSAFDLISTKVESGGRSDHVPLVATLRWRGPL